MNIVLLHLNCVRQGTVILSQKVRTAYDGSESKAVSRILYGTTIFGAGGLSLKNTPYPPAESGSMLVTDCWRPPKRLIHESIKAPGGVLPPGRHPYAPSPRAANQPAQHPLILFKIHPHVHCQHPGRSSLSPFNA